MRWFLRYHLIRTVITERSGTNQAKHSGSLCLLCGTCLQMPREREKASRQGLIVYGRHSWYRKRPASQIDTECCKGGNVDST